MKILMAVAFAFLSIQLSAQRTVDVTSGDVNAVSLYTVVGGEPIVMAKFVKLVEGSRYFKDDWMKGIIIMPSGQEHKNISLKLDLYENNVHYLDEKAGELIASGLIKEVILIDEVNDVNYRFVHSSALEKITGVKKGWYQWLHTGTSASLYKFFNKTLVENKPYGSATTEQSIKTTSQYLVLYNNALLEIKKLKDAPAVLANKKNDLEEFLKTKDSKDASMDIRMTALILYYNTLLVE